MRNANPSEIDPDRTPPADSGLRQLQMDHGSFLAYRRRSASGDGIGRPGIVFLGGFKSDLSGTKATALDAFCCARRLGFLRFDYSGHGASGGDFLHGSISRWTADALAAIDRLTEGPLILVGSSMGGWIMLLVALARHERVKGLVGIAAAPDFTEALIWQGLPAAARAQLLKAGRLERPSEYSANPTVITRTLIEDGRKHLLLGGPIAIAVPVRLLHGTADRDVPHGLSLRLAERLVSEDVVVSLVKDGDHRLSRPQDLARLRAAIDELVQAPAESSARNPSR
jgi:pimeloyl-ACP methyl ester carboxylesterase